jgi:hypothetical protein
VNASPSAELFGTDPEPPSFSAAVGPTDPTGPDGPQDGPLETAGPEGDAELETGLGTS